MVEVFDVEGDSLVRRIEYEIVRPDKETQRTTGCPFNITELQVVLHDGTNIPGTAYGNWIGFQNGRIYGTLKDIGAWTLYNNSSIFEH